MGKQKRGLGAFTWIALIVGGPIAVGACIYGAAEIGTTGWIVIGALYFLDRHFANQAAIRFELEEMNARERERTAPPRDYGP